MWPQFDEGVLEETLSLSEAARQSLNRKRETMKDFHKDILEHHGLAPKSEPAAAMQEPAGPQEELPFHLHETDPDAPAPPRIQRGASGTATPGAIHYGNDTLPYTTPDYQMSKPRMSVQVPAMEALLCPAKLRPSELKTPFAYRRTEKSG